MKTAIAVPCEGPDCNNRASLILAPPSEAPISACGFCVLALFKAVLDVGLPLPRVRILWVPQ